MGCGGSKAETSTPAKQPAPADATLLKEPESPKKARAAPAGTDAPPPPPPEANFTILTFNGKLGVGCNRATGEITNVPDDSKAKEAGVQVGWIITRVDDSPYSFELLAEACKTGQPYRLTFRKATEGQGTVAAQDNPSTEKVTFVLGELVERRDRGQSWGAGYVTSIDPLLVGDASGSGGAGYRWDEVQKASLETLEAAAAKRVPPPPAEPEGQGSLADMAAQDNQVTVDPIVSREVAAEAPIAAEMPVSGNGRGCMQFCCRTENKTELVMP